MIPMLGLSGASETGKTTLIERLVPELQGRGYRVAVLKHTKDYVAWDQEGKDSWRMAQAGTTKVVISSPQHIIASTALDHDLSLDEALRFVGTDCDMVLVEGYKQATMPRIAVHRKETGHSPDLDRHGLMAVVTDEPLEVKVPQFSWDDVKGIADYIAGKLLSSPESVQVGLFVNGVSVRLSPFVEQIIASTTAGMASALKGVGEIKSIDVSVRKVEG